MYIGDVGQNNIEEVNIGVAGANYGWPTCEGPCNVAGFTNPIYSYLHNGRDSAITGGLVYRGTQFPAAYQGVYFFADYAQKWIQYLTLDSNGQSTGVNYFAPTDGSPDGPFGNPVCFRMGPDGALYYVDIGVSFTGVINPPANPPNPLHRCQPTTRRRFERYSSQRRAPTHRLFHRRQFLGSREPAADLFLDVR